MWSLTINSFTGNLETDYPYSGLKERLSQHCKHFIVGKEIGLVTKRPHYQCYVNLKNRTQSPMRVLFGDIEKTSTLFKNITFSPASKASLKEYVMKSGNYFSSDQPDRNYYTIMPLNPIQRQIADIILTKANTRSIFVFSDMVGGSGKTELIKTIVSVGAGIVVPTVGTSTSISFVVIKRLQQILSEGSKQKQYVLLDLTKTSKIFFPDALAEVFSLMEGLVSGCCSAAFNGNQSTILCAPGKFVPVVFTNAGLFEFATLMSRDRMMFYKIIKQKDGTRLLNKQKLL